jgi:hypothetical protein
MRAPHLARGSDGHDARATFKRARTPQELTQSGRGPKRG